MAQTHPIYGRIDGPIVIIGFGSIGKGTWPLIERHFDYDADKLVVVEPDPALGGVPALVTQFAAKLGCASAWGLASGHCRPNLTLPLGAAVRLDSEAGTLSLEASRAC